MATNDIVGVTVLGAAPHNGWGVEVEIEGWAANIGGITYDFGFDSSGLPTASSAELTVVSEGYNTSAVLGTITRSAYLTKEQREPYPSQTTITERVSGSNLIVTVALSAPIFNDDKNGGAGTSGTDPVITIPAGVFNNGTSDNTLATGLAVTNNSTLDYPKAFGRWVYPDKQVVTGDFIVEFDAHSYFGRNARPVAVVQFEATDGTNSITPILIDAETISAHNTAGNPVSSYRATIPVSSLTDGLEITVNAVVYPWVGDADSVFDTDTAADGSTDPTDPGPQSYRNNKAGAYGSTVYVAIDPTSGNDGTGAASIVSEVNAQLTPFATFDAAISAGVAQNNTTNSRNNGDGLVVVLNADTYTDWIDSGTTDLANADVWTLFKAADNAAAGTVIISPASANSAMAGWFRFKDVSFAASVVGLFRGPGALSSKLWIEDSPSFVNTGSTVTFYRWNECHITGSTVGSVTNGFGNFSTNLSPFVIVRGNDFTASTEIPEYCLVGNTGDFHLQQITVETYRPNADAIIIKGNTVPIDGLFWRTGDSTITLGIAVANNIIELAGAGGAAAFSFFEGTEPSTHTFFRGNTIVGGRVNIWYNDTGSLPVVRTLAGFKGNAVLEVNIKADLFTVADGGRTGNWAPVNGVGIGYNHSGRNSGFEPEFAGLNRTTGAFGFTSDASDETGTGLGGGDYTPAGGSTLLARMPLLEQYSRYDTLGNERVDNGDLGGIETQTASSGVNLDVVPGELSFVGETVSLTVSDTVTLDIVPGELTFSGEVVSLEVSSGIDLDVVPGNLTLSGEILSLGVTDNVALNVVAGQLEFGGEVVSLDISGQIQLDITPGEISFAGETVTLEKTEDLNLTITPGSYSLSGQVVSLAVSGSLEFTRRTVFMPRETRTIHMMAESRQINLVA